MGLIPQQAPSVLCACPRAQNELVILEGPAPTYTAVLVWVDGAFCSGDSIWRAKESGLFALKSVLYFWDIGNIILIRKEKGPSILFTDNSMGCVFPKTGFQAWFQQCFGQLWCLHLPKALTSSSAGRRKELWSLLSECFPSDTGQQPVSSDLRNSIVRY